MTILHVISSMDPVTGGPSQGIRNLDTAMRENGAHREVVCLDDPKSAYLGSDDFPIHALGAGIGPWNYNSKLSTWLKANIQRFDIVIINGLWLYCSFATWNAVRRLKQRSKSSKLPKVFVMPHGMLDPYFQRDSSRKIKAVRNWFYWKLIESRVVNDADGILFTCQTELELAATTFTPYHPKAVYNAGYGIDQPPAYTPAMASAFAERCPGLAPNPYLLFISRIHPKKGTDLLLTAYIQLHEQAQSENNTIPQLVIAGPGLETSFGKKLLAELAEHPLVQKDVFFPGMLTGDAKWGSFYGCDAFVLPSHQENFGIVVAEALACAKPVLISNQVNIWHEIHAGQGGLTAEDTITGTQGMLDTWFNTSEAEKRVIALHAEMTYRNHFFIDNVAKNYITIFISL